MTALIQVLGLVFGVLLISVGMMECSFIRDQRRHRFFLTEPDGIETTLAGNAELRLLQRHLGDRCHCGRPPARGSRRLGRTGRPPVHVCGPCGPRPHLVPVRAASLGQRPRRGRPAARHHRPGARLNGLRGAPSGRGSYGFSAGNSGPGIQCEDGTVTSETSRGIVRSSELTRFHLAPNPGPMSLDGTNSYLIGAPEAAGRVAVDPGPLDEPHLRALAGDGTVELILITHRHADHTAAAARFSELTGAPVRAADPAHCHGAPPLEDGETILAAGVEIRVVATPGHTSDSLCFHLPQDGPHGSVLTGDTILGSGTTVLDYPDGTLRDYLESLDRLERLGPGRCAAGPRPGAAGTRRRRPRLPGSPAGQARARSAPPSSPWARTPVSAPSRTPCTPTSIPPSAVPRSSRSRRSWTTCAADAAWTGEPVRLEPCVSPGL